MYRETTREAETRCGYVIIERAAGLFTTLGEKPPEEEAPVILIIMLLMPLSEKEQKDVPSRRHTVSIFTNGEAYVFPQRESIHICTSHFENFISHFRVIAFYIFR